jgi:hypothetical protein
MKLFSKVATGISVFAVCILTGGVSTGVSALKQVPAENEASATTQATDPPGTLGNFRIVERTGSQLQLDWNWVAGGTGTLHYELSYADKTLVLNQYYPGFTLDARNLDLSPGHTYTFSLWAVDEVGRHSVVPAELLFETTPPSSPSHLTQLSTKMGYPDLISFKLSTDTASPIRGYEAFLDGRSFGIINGTDNEFSLFDQVSTAYLPPPTGPATLQLRAYDSSFNTSQLSEPLTVLFP